MLTLRQRIFVMISIVVAILLLALLYFLFVKRPVSQPDASGPLAGQPATPRSESAVTPSSQSAPVTPVLTPVAPAAPQTPPEDLYLRQLATIFVERFWSYSNQNGDKHIADTLALATPQMQTWMKTRIGDPSRLYEGVTTEVLQAALAKKAGAAATVEIGAVQAVSRESATGTPAMTSVVNRTGRVELKQLAGEWKVDGLYWDK